MEEYVSLDKQIEITDIRGGTIKTTVRHILDRNNARYHVQPIVRCINCKYYEGLACCKLIGDCGGTNWFCGWGEKKPRKQKHE